MVRRPGNWYGTSSESTKTPSGVCADVPATALPRICRCEPKGALTGSNAGITSIEFDSAGSYVLAASNDFASRLWTVDDYRLRPITGNFRSVTEVSAKASGRRVGNRFFPSVLRASIVALNGPESPSVPMAVMWRGALQVWNVLTGKLDCTLGQNHCSAINSVSWSPSGTYVVSVEKGSKAVLWSDM